MMGAFHFIRPEWLLILPLLGLIWWFARRTLTGNTEVGDLIAPHLRQALIVNSQSGNRLRAVDGVILSGCFLALAAAGPTWSRIPSPWFSETAPLVIAVEVSDSMRANDVLPTRLDRARFKILDLIAARTGARTAIIAYAGSAHIVVPPSSDLAVLKPLLESLDPAVMPIQGTQIETVLPLAMEMLGEDHARGSVLFVNDGFRETDVNALRSFTNEPANPGLFALVVGTNEGGVALMPDGSPVAGTGGARLDTRVNTNVLRQVEDASGMVITRMRTDDSDLRTLLARMASHLAAAADPESQWRDEGWWLLWPAALLMLFWFRRGWTMQW